MEDCEYFSNKYCTIVTKTDRAYLPLGRAGNISAASSHAHGALSGEWQRHRCCGHGSCVLKSPGVYGAKTAFCLTSQVRHGCRIRLVRVCSIQ
jgi:hypothetical protein